METIEIRSSHDLSVSVPGPRPMAKSAYRISCRQFMVVLRDRERSGKDRDKLLPVMTLGLERIWITPEEVEQVVDAIQAMRSPVMLE